jgi:hypothetical protein
MPPAAETLEKGRPGVGRLRVFAVIESLEGPAPVEICRQPRHLSRARFG